MLEKESQSNKIKSFKPEFPVGEARKLAELTSREWRKHLLLFSRVENKVLEINPAFEGSLPLKLEEGKSSPLGLFAEAAFQEKPSELLKGKQALEFWPKHQRSAILGRIIFSDKEGRIYRDIDLKGVGYFFENYSPSPEVSKELGKGKKGDRFGLLNRDIAFFDRQMSEEFFKAGIRTHRYLAMIELKELIAHGQKISLAEAIKSGIIDKDFKPVIEVRAFGTKFRVDDLLGNEEAKELLIKDAKTIVSQELGRKKVFSNEEYLEWFAKTLGRNVGLMHKNGWAHNFLNAHNVTLDCRIVDLDSVTELNDRNRESDADIATAVIIRLKQNISPFNPAFNLMDIFWKSYESVFPSGKKE